MPLQQDNQVKVNQDLETPLTSWVSRRAGCQSSWCLGRMQGSFPGWWPWGWGCRAENSAPAPRSSPSPLPGVEVNIWSKIHTGAVKNQISDPFRHLHCNYTIKNLLNELFYLFKTCMKVSNSDLNHLKNLVWIVSTFFIKKIWGSEIC